MKLTFKGDKMSHGGAGGRTEEASFTLDATQQPKTLDMTPTTGPDKGKAILGIYQLDGDTLKICAAKPETARPKEFKEGKEAVLLEVKTREAVKLLRRILALQSTSSCCANKGETSRHPRPLFRKG